MHPTPDLSHLTQEDFKHVYDPAEDTFILLDALEADAPRLVNFQPFICLEIGRVRLRSFRPMARPYQITASCDGIKQIR